MKKLLSTLKHTFFSRLSVQLVVSFLGVFMVLILASLAIIYLGMVQILTKKSENYAVQHFQQCEYNISSFCQDVDLISRQLTIDSDLQDLADYANMSDTNRILHTAQVISRFRSILGTYHYIDSILYYGADGLVIRSNLLEDYVETAPDSESDPFYTSAAYKSTKENKQKMTWFGGYTNRDYFALATNRSTTTKPCISAARTTMANSRSGIIIINVDMRYFTSVFNNAYNPEMGVIYLLDDSNTVIATQDSELWNRTMPGLVNEYNSQETANFTQTAHEDGKQVTYYHLSDFDGTLVREVPLSEIVRDTVFLRNILVVIFFFSVVIAFILMQSWVRKLLAPLKNLIVVIQKMEQGNLGLLIDMPQKKGQQNELSILSHQFNKMSKSIKELFDQIESSEQEKRDLEMASLRWQINPHFFFNTLNSIKWMAAIRKEDAIVESITAFGEFLDPVFRNQDMLCTVEEEIGYIRNYIKVMNYRFAGGVECRFLVPSECLHIKVLRFILQPVVENSISHGLSHKFKGTIAITASHDTEQLILCIEDDGQGILPEKLEQLRSTLKSGIGGEDNIKGGIGLGNVNRRLQLHFGDEYGLEVYSQVGIGTKVVFRLPFVQ